MAGLEDNELCQMCNRNKYVYVCPRCNAAYCSVNCYKAPSHLECSESFYKECVENEMKNNNGNPESRKKILDILSKYNTPSGNGSDFEEELDSDDDLLSINKRMEGVDLDDSDAVWEKLTEEEQREFTQMVKTGDINKLVPVWNPWWTQKHHKKKIHFVEEKINEGYDDNVPGLFLNTPLFTSISKSKPSELVYFNLLNILAAYVICCRYFNGNHLSVPQLAAAVVANVSKNLGSNEVFKSSETAVSSAFQVATSDIEIQLDPVDYKVLQEDIQHLIEGPNELDKKYYVKAALSDLRVLLIKAKTNEKIGMFSNKFNNFILGVKFLKRGVLNKLVKKTEYYLSWVNEYL